MGTTGGDREKLLEDVEHSGVYAVIAPQMGKQVRVRGQECTASTMASLHGRRSARKEGFVMICYPPGWYFRVSRL